MDFGFGFNDAFFSDRVLHIEVIDGCLDSNGDDSTKVNVVEVKTLHVSSLVLAASSPFFYKLFKIGMKESQQRDVTLRINASEDLSLMDILKFIYSNKLSASTTPDLLGVLIVADKFEVTCCMRYCIRLLEKVPLSLESALSYLQLPSSVLLAEVAQPLIVATKEYIAANYSDLNTFRKEVMDLPLCAVEVVLGSNGLQVYSEDDVFDFILEWATSHYPKPKERREILTEHMVQCIRFHYMSCSKLKEVLVCPDFRDEQVSKLVLEALFLKVEVPYLRDIHGSKELSTTYCNSLDRIHKYQPIKVVQLEFAQPRCVVFFDIRKEELEYLFVSRDSRINSQPLRLGGRWFYLFAEYSIDNSFRLYVQITKESESCSLGYEFAVIKKPTMEFQQIRKDKFCYPELFNAGFWYPALFGISWIDFMREDSEYFVDGILHFRADLTIIV